MKSKKFFGVALAGVLIVCSAGSLHAKKKINGRRVAFTCLKGCAKMVAYPLLGAVVGRAGGAWYVSRMSNCLTRRTPDLVSPFILHGAAFGGCLAGLAGGTIGGAKDITSALKQLAALKKKKEADKAQAAREAQAAKERKENEEKSARQKTVKR